ncbi:Inosose dehydratase [Mycovorax composti]|jgi:Xylose isomerase-like TIM barrel.|uniref:Inosose dehydratase n=2 Tax=Chitinophagaceae TaxID=563835 RepID=A0ABZ2EG53_9BACT
MSTISRREWCKISLAGMTGMLISPSLQHFSLIEEQYKEVIIGVQSYSFRDRNLDEAIAAMQQLGFTSCELWTGHVEPREFMWKRDATPEERKRNAEGLKRWRETVTMDQIEAIAEKFKKAGIRIQAFNGTFNKRDSEKEFELVFKIAKTLGTDTITTSTTVDQMGRIDVLARKYQIKVGMHNHSHVEDPNQFATPESFMRGMEGKSDFIRINLDIGHFTAANYDPVDFIKKYHDKIVCLHIKDRKKNQGRVVPFGQGDTPIVDVLQLIRDKGWPIPCNIEYEYAATDALTEIKKCIDYCKNALKA